MAAEEGKSTLTIELDTRQAKTNAHDLAVQLTNVDQALGKIDRKLQNTKNWQMKIDMVMNPINVMNEFNKIQRTLNQSNQKIKLDSEFKAFAARNEIAKVQSAVNKTNQKISLDVKLNTQNVKSELGKVQQQVSAASGKIQVSVDTSSAKASASALTAEMKTAMESISKAATALTNHLEAENQKRLADNKKANEAIVANNKRSATDSQSIASKMAASVVSMKPIEDSMKLERTLRESSLAETRRIEAQKAKEAQKAAQEMVKGYVDAYAAINRQVQASASTTRAAMEQTFKSFASQRKFTPEVKQATFQSKDTASFADIKAIQAEAKQVEKAWRDMYAGVQLEAKNNLTATKALSNAAIADIKSQTQAKIEAIKQETALSASERKNAIASIQASSKEIIASMRSIPEAAKASWAGVLDSSKAAMSAGIAAAKATETAQITGFKAVEAAKRASDRAIEEADNAVFSNLEGRLRSSSASAKAMVDEFTRLNGLGNYEAVKNLETSLDKLRTGFANIKFGDNTSQLNGIQDKLTSAYQKAADAARAYSEGRVADALRMIAETKNEISTLEALRKQILSTGAAAQSLSGRSFMSDSLRSAAEQIEIVASRLRELGSFTRFDSVNALKSQIDSIAVSIQKIPNIGSADLVKALDNITLAYKHLEAAAIASSKGQGFAYMSRMADANKALEKVKQLETELNRFSNAKLQTSQLSAAFEADAKKAIASAKEVGKIKMSVYDDEINKGRQAISDRDKLDSNYMRAFEARAAQERTIHKASVDQQTRDTIAAVEAQNAAYQRRVDRISRMDESRVGTVEARNAVLSRTVSGGAYSNVQGTTVNRTGYEQEIRQTGVLTRAHLDGRQAQEQADSRYFSNLLGNLGRAAAATWLFQQAMSKAWDWEDKIQQTALTSQKMTTVMTVITGSSQKAREEIEWLREESDRLGLSFEAAATPFAKFAAAAKGMFDPSQIKEMFTQLGKVSVAMHLDQVETKGVFLAIQQMASKGKVSLEELRLQFAERIPGAMTIAADSMDMTMTQFVKSVSNGQMMTEDFLPKFLANLESAFGQAADIASQSLTGAIARFDNALFLMWETIGKGGAAQAIQEASNRIAEFIKTNSDLLNRVGLNVGRIITTITDGFLRLMKNEELQNSIVNMFSDLITVMETIITLTTKMISGFAALGQVASSSISFAGVGATLGAAGGGLLGIAGGPVGMAGGAVAGAGAGLKVGAALGAGYGLAKSVTGNGSAREQAALTEKAVKDRHHDTALLLTDVESTIKAYDKAAATAKKYGADTVEVFNDIRQAAEDALKPKTLNEHTEAMKEAIDKMAKMEDDLAQKRRSQNIDDTRQPAYKPSSILAPKWLQATEGVGDLSKYASDWTSKPIRAATNILDDLVAARKRLSDLEKKPEGIEALAQQKVLVANLVEEYGKAKDRLESVNKENLKAKATMEGLATTVVSEFQKSQKSFEGLDNSIANMNTELEVFTKKSINYDLMAPDDLTAKMNELSKSTKGATTDIAAFEAKTKAVDAERIGLEGQLEVTPAGAKKDAMMYRITELNQEMDKYTKESGRLISSTKAATIEWEHAAAAADAYNAMIYTQNHLLENMQRKQADKSQIDTLSKTFNTAGLTAEIQRTSDSLNLVTAQLQDAKRLKDQLDFNKDNNGRQAADTEVLRLTDERKNLEDHLKDAFDAQLVIQNKITEAYKEQYKTQMEIAALIQEINLELGDEKSISSMSIEELLGTKGSYTPMTLKMEADVTSVQETLQKVEMTPVEIKLTTGKDITNLVKEAGAKYGVDPALIKAIMAHESGFKPNARGSSGEVGLMQLMPSTADWLNVNPYDIKQNVEGGAKYLQFLKTQFESLDKVIAAYNAGQGTIQKKGIINPEYVKIVKSNLEAASKEANFNVTLNTKDLKSDVEGVRKSILTPVVMPVDSSGIEFAVGETQKLASHTEAAMRYELERLDLLKKAQALPSGSLEKEVLMNKAKEIESSAKRELGYAQQIVKTLRDRIVLEDKLYNLPARNKAKALQDYNFSKVGETTGANAIPQIEAGNVAVRQQIIDKTNALKASESSVNDINAGLALAKRLNDQQKIGQFSQELTSEIAKQVTLEQDINDLQDQYTKGQEKINTLMVGEQKILDDQRKTLKDLTLTNKFGKAGAEYEKMKEFLTPEAFDEWNTDRQQLEIQQFVDAAGLGADSIASSFTNAFSQILVDGASFTDTMQNMFKDMTNRIMNESINLIAKNLMSLGSGGSWAQIGLGVVGVGVGLLGQWLSKEPKKAAPSSAMTNPQKYLGSGTMKAADVFGRDMSYDIQSSTLRQYNQKLNQVISFAYDNMDAINGVITQFTDLISSKLSAAFPYVADLFSQLGEIGSQLYDQFAAPVIEAGTKFVDWVVSLGSKAVDAVVGTGGAVAGQAASAASQVVSEVAQDALWVIKVIKFGWDIYTIATDKMQTTAMKAADALYTVSDALISLGPVGAIVAAVLNIVGAIVDITSGDKSRGTWRGALGPFEGSMSAMLTKKVPDTWVNLFNPQATNNQYDASKIAGLPSQGVFGDRKDIGDGYWTRGDGDKARKSLFVGKATRLGAMEVSYHEVPVPVDTTAMVDLSKKIVGLYDRVNSDIADAADAIDAKQGLVKGATVTKFLESLYKEPLGWRQKIAKADAGSAAAGEYGKIFTTMADTGTLAGQVMKTIYTNLMTAFVNISKDNSAFSFNVAEVTAVLAPVLADLPVKVIDDLTKSIKVLVQGGNPQEVLDAISANINTYSKMFVMLDDPRLGVKASFDPTQISGLIKSWSNLGIEIQSTGDAWISFVDIWNKSDITKGIERTFDNINAAWDSFVDGFVKKGLTKSQAISTVGVMAVGAKQFQEMGFKGGTLLESSKKFAEAAQKMAYKNLDVATAAIDSAIAKGKEEKVLNESMTREQMVGILVRTNAIEAATVAEADYAIQINKSAGALLEGLNFYQTLVDSSASGLETLGNAFSNVKGTTVDLTQASQDLITTFGSVAEAAKRANEAAAQVFSPEILAKATGQASQKGLGRILESNPILAEAGLTASTTSKDLMTVITNLYMKAAGTTTADLTDVASWFKGIVVDKAYKPLVDSVLNFVAGNDQAAQSLTALRDSLQTVTAQALTPVAGGLNAVDTSSQSFTNSMLYLAQAFGSAQTAADFLSTRLSKIYSGQELSQIQYGVAKTGFDTTAKEAGLSGLRVEDAQAAEKYLYKNYISQGKGAEKLTFNGKEATAADWAIGLGKALTPIETASTALTSSLGETAQTVASMGGSSADFADAAAYGTDKLTQLADGASKLSTALDGLRSDSLKSLRTVSQAKTQNEDLFKDPLLQGIWQTFGVTSAAEAQAALQKQANRPDFSQAKKDEIAMQAELDKPQNKVVSALFDQFIQNTVSILSPALQAADQAAGDLSAQLEQQAQNAKDLAALYKDVNKQIDELKTSDIGKIFVDIASSIQDIIDKAADLGDTRLLVSQQTGGLLQPGDMVTNTKGGGYEITKNPNPSQYSTPVPDIGELRTLKVNEAFKSYFSSFLDKWETAGMTEIQKGLKGILDPYDKGLTDLQEFFDKANKAVPNTFSDKQLADAEASLEKLKQLDIAEYFKGIVQSVNEEFDKIGKSDLTINLDSIATFINEELQKVVDMEAQGIPGAQAYKDKVIAVAIDRGQAATKDIYNEYLNIGATDYAKSLKEINTWLADSTERVDLITAAYKDQGATTESVTAGIKAVAAARIQALNDERKKIIEDAKTTYARTPSAMYQKTTPIAADLEGQLWSVRDSFIGTIDSVIQAGGDFTDVLALVKLAFATGTSAIEKAKSDIEDKFRGIASAIQDAFASIFVNQVRIKVGDTAAQIESDRYMREKALKVLNDLQGTSYDEQMQAINDLQSATMSRYDREKAAITELSDFVQQLQDYTKSLLVNENLSPLSNTERLKEAGVQFQDTFTAATSPIESEARKKARGELTSKADTYLTEARKYYAGTPEYVKIFEQVTGQLKGVTETGKSPQEQLVDLNKDMLLQLEDAAKYLQLIEAAQLGTGGAKDKELLKIDEVIGKVVKDFSDQVNALVKAAGLITTVTTDKVEVDTTTLTTSIDELINGLSTAITDPALLNNVGAPIKNGLETFAGNVETGLSSVLWFDKATASVQRGIDTFAQNIEDGLSSVIWFEKPTEYVQAGINAFAKNIFDGLSSIIWFDEPTTYIQTGINTFAANIQTGLSALTWFEEPTTFVQAGINAFATNIQLGLGSLTWFEEPVSLVQAGITAFATNVQIGLSSLMWFEEPTTLVQAGINTFAANMQAGLGSLLWLEDASKAVQTGINTFAFNVQTGLSSLMWFEEPTALVQAGINTFAANIQTGLGTLTWFEEPSKLVQAGLTTFATNIQVGLGSVPIDNSGINSAINGLFGAISSQIASSISAATSTLASINAQIDTANSILDSSTPAGSTGTGSASNPWPDLIAPIGGGGYTGSGTRQTYATGGYYPGGLALVGEKGPELINFENPGQVYTAEQTKSLLSPAESEPADYSEIVNAIMLSARTNAKGQEELRKELANAKEEIALLNRKLAKLAADA